MIIGANVDEVVVYLNEVDIMCAHFALTLTTIVNIFASFITVPQVVI